jgi:hypothetical protein
MPICLYMSICLGGAKLARNPNSSRFGRYVEVVFSKDEVLLGGSVKCFLLETVLVCAQVRPPNPTYFMLLPYITY